MKLGSISICEKFEVKNDEGDTYLIRYRLIKTPWFGIYLHRILRSDDDRDLHDHPFSFLTLILKTGYVEQTPGGKKWKRPGSIIWHRAEDLHRLEIPEGKTTWTFFIRGPKRRSWGFATEDGWIDWRVYLDYKRIKMEFSERKLSVTHSRREDGKFDVHENFEDGGYVHTIRDSEEDVVDYVEFLRRWYDVIDLGEVENADGSREVDEDTPSTR